MLHKTVAKISHLTLNMCARYLSNYSKKSYTLAVFHKTWQCIWL